MSAPPSVSCVAQIGEMAGVVWRTLNANGAMSLTKLVKSVGQPRDGLPARTKCGSRTRAAAGSSRFVSEGSGSPFA